jgi:hypothetical protein
LKSDPCQRFLRSRGNSSAVPRPVAPFQTVIARSSIERRSNLLSGFTLPLRRLLRPYRARNDINQGLARPLSRRRGNRLYCIKNICNMVNDMGIAVRFKRGLTHPQQPTP